QTTTIIQYGRGIAFCGDRSLPRDCDPHDGALPYSLRHQFLRDRTGQCLVRLLAVLCIRNRHALPLSRGRLARRQPREGRPAPGRVCPCPEIPGPGGRDLSSRSWHHGRYVAVPPRGFYPVWYPAPDRDLGDALAALLPF